MEKITCKKKVAAIITEYRYNSHADVILGRLLGDIEYSPRIEVVSMYTDQIPANDMSREIAARNNIPIYKTIAEAIKVGDMGTRIDGVIIIGEHGDYPWNEKQQRLYPRKRLMEETLRALDELALTVPIFSDKHLSYDTREAAWIYRQIKQRNIPFMGGSSIPLTDLAPSFDPIALETAKEWFVVSFLGIESYGFHGMEVMQFLAEQRAGGETGIATIHALAGEEVWAAMARNEWPEDLLCEALAKQPSPPKEHPKDHVKDPVIFIIHYLDGSRGYVIQLQSFVQNWSFAFRNDSGITSALCKTTDRPFMHFGRLTEFIENLVIDAKAPFPMERTYLTTGLINLGMESLYQKVPLEAPELWITYGGKK